MRDFDWPVRVYWEDTDAGGVVYHTSYIRYFERGRTEWLRQRGFSQTRMADETGLIFSVVDLDTQFAAPARLDDLLIVRTRVVGSRGATVSFEQQILKDADARILVTGRVRVACIDARSFKPRRLPATFREEFC